MVSKSERPFKLSRKRLDKAVSAALEAAQILEEEDLVKEKTNLKRKEKANLKELKRRRELLFRQELKKVRASRNGLGIDMGEVPNSPFSSNQSSDLDDETSRRLERDFFSALASLSSDSERLDEESEADEGEDQDPNLALDLYISSVSHLLNALPASSSTTNPSSISPQLSTSRKFSKERLSPTSRALSLFSSSSEHEQSASEPLRNRTLSSPANP